jgi:hypothetical protein
MTHKKEWRIRNVLQPIFERGNFWIRKDHQSFIEEFVTFPKGRFVDILDALAYTPQMLKHPMRDEDYMKWRGYNRRQARAVGQPYSVSIN